MFKSSRNPEISFPHSYKTNLIPFDSIVSKSSTDVGRTNLFKIYISTSIPPIAYKPYTIPFKYQKLIDEEIQLLEIACCILKSLSLWTAPVIVIPKKRDKPQLCLVLDYWLLNKSINTAHNGNKVILYLPPVKHNRLTCKVKQM